MAGNLRRSNSNSRSSLLHSHESRNASEASACSLLGREMGNLSVSNHAAGAGEKHNKRRNGSGCLGLHLSAGGCRVCACEELDSSARRQSGRVVGGVEETGLECFSYGMSERFWKKGGRKEKAVVAHRLASPDAAAAEASLSLPDDVMEMVLCRLPLASLMAARCVCKKWRDLTTSPQFLRLRSEGSHRTAWLLLFGVTRDGCNAGTVHALDVSADRWHRIGMDRLKGRFLFSIAGVGNEVYVVGGRSGSSEMGSLKTHKGVLVYSPLTGSWRKAASMRLARSRPVLGVFEMSDGCSILHSRAEKHDQHAPKSRLGRVSNVYEDPHRLSIRRRLRDVLSEDGGSLEFAVEHDKFVRQEARNRPRLALIAVGGHGCWDEPLESGEIYDPMTDKWVEIVGFPADIGPACSGAVCGQMFYVYCETDRLVAYHLEKGFWVVIQTSRPPPRLRDYSPTLLCCRSRLFMSCVSWCDRDGPINRREKVVRKLFELDLSMLKWNEASGHPDAPMDPNAAFAVDQDRIYTVEMFRIFGKVLDFVTACQVSDTEQKWSRITRKNVAHEAEALSCRLKSMAVLHL